MRKSSSLQGELFKIEMNESHPSPLLRKKNTYEINSLSEVLQLAQSRKLLYLSNQELRNNSPRNLTYIVKKSFQ